MEMINKLKSRCEQEINIQMEDAVKEENFLKVSSTFALIDYFSAFIYFIFILILNKNNKQFYLLLLLTMRPSLQGGMGCWRNIDLW